MKDGKKFVYGLLFLLNVGQLLAQSAAGSNVANGNQNHAIGVIELRNYLVQDGQAGKFNELFASHFEKPMEDMGVAVLGRYRIKNDDSHFVWIRGYGNRPERVKFLNDFYYRNAEWKQHKKEANALIRNSDNVHLLRPLVQTAPDKTQTVSRSAFEQNKPFVVIDFYTANTRLPELVAFYTNSYLPLLRSAGIVPTLWVSDTIPNDFPQLPVFQDSNLLVSIAYYDSESDYNTKTKLLEKQLIDNVQLKLLDIVTIHSQLLLNRFEN